jgi:hypothetical protein
MTALDLNALKTYRALTYRLNPGQQLSSLPEAVDYVKSRGFSYFWPIKGIDFPSLWTAVAGDRPVANAHDDPGHMTWGWKDGSLGKRLWYYGKILRKKATMINLEVAPYFYALSENYGDPAEDVLIQYHEGHLTQEAKAIFEALLDNGPLDTIAIRRKTRMTSKESNYRYDRAITLLQSDFKILPVGISDAGAWRYAFIYDLVHRYYPEIPAAARHIGERKARQKLTETYFKSVGAAQFRDVSLLFQWPKSETEKAIQQLVSTHKLIPNLKNDQRKGEWFALPELVDFSAQ